MADHPVITSVPRYRFLSLYADGECGQAVTKPLNFQSDEIYLNFAASAYGYVVVKVLGLDGEVRFTAEEFFGNEISTPLHVDGLKGTAGRLVFELKEAHLYAVGSAMI